MIVWIDGAFGAGKTTLTEHLLRELPGAMEFDPEEVGFLLTRWVPPAASGDFQDLPVWRRVVADVALGLRAEYGRPLVVPMTLADPAVRDDLFDRIRAGGEPIVHVWLDVSAAELRRRIEHQVLLPDDAAADQEAREFRLGAVERCTAARRTLPPGTTVLDAEHRSPADLARAVVELVGGPA